MSTISGRGGFVYAIGDEFEFENVPLHDIGTGWDWRAPEDLRCWVPESVSFEVQDMGRWRRAGTVDVYHRLGVVSFDRCLAGLQVRASGTCLPTTRIGEGEAWKIEVETVVRDVTVLGDHAPMMKARTLGAYATINAVVREPVDRALVLLPGYGGAFAGIGKAACVSSRVDVGFDEEGVCFGYY